MALIHFVMVLSWSNMNGSFLEWLFNRISGRPATVFMILAGIGVSLRFVDKTDDDAIASVRTSLFRRGWAFLLIGFLNLALWPGDILRVYGIAYLCAAALAFSSRNRLLAYALSVAAMFTVCLFLIDFETNWDFETLEYANVWTLHGGAMNLFYNGFRAVLPWLGVMFFGMWIGRFDLRSNKVRRVFFVYGILAWGIAELASFGLLRMMTPFVSPDEIEDLVAIFGTDSLPPMPLFLLSSCGFAIATIMLCIHACELWPGKRWLSLTSAGQLAFTWYIAHIVIVIAVGLSIDFRGDVPLPIAYLVSGSFFLAMCAVSLFYRGCFRYGPLEWALRKMVR